MSENIELSVKPFLTNAGRQVLVDEVNYAKNAVQKRPTNKKGKKLFWSDYIDSRFIDDLRIYCHGTESVLSHEYVTVEMELEMERRCLALTEEETRELKVAQQHKDRSQRTELLKELEVASTNADVHGFQSDDIAERDVKDFSEFTDPQDPGYHSDTSLGVGRTYEGEEPSTVGYGLEGRDGYNFDYKSERSDAPFPEAPLSFTKAYNDKQRAHMEESDDDKKHYRKEERRRGKSKKQHPESSSVRDIVPNKKVREALCSDEYAPSTHSREYLPSTGSAYGYPEYPSTAAPTSSHYAGGTAIPRRDPRMTSGYSAYDHYPPHEGQAMAGGPRRPLQQNARHPADPYHTQVSPRHPLYSPSSSYQQGGRPVPTFAHGNTGEPYYGTQRSGYGNSPDSQRQSARRGSISAASGSGMYSTRTRTLASAAVPYRPPVGQEDLEQRFSDLSFTSGKSPYDPRRPYY